MSDLKAEPQLALVRRILRRYSDTNSEFAALQVVARGLFLAVVLVIAFLFVLTFVTDLISGQNEIVIPVNGVDSAVDLGAITRDFFSRASASVVTATGVLTFAISAFLTTKALRDGTRRALLGPETPKSRWRDPWTLPIAVGLACVVLLTWLLALATALRRAAWSALLGTELPDVAVNLGKALCIVGSVAVIVIVVSTVHRVVTRRWPRLTDWLIITALALIVVTANFFLLYTYIGALVNPQVSAGIVLIFTIMLWVNIVVRVYLGGLCWVSSRTPHDDQVSATFPT